MVSFPVRPVDAGRACRFVENCEPCQFREREHALREGGRPVREVLPAHAGVRCGVERVHGRFMGHAPLVGERDTPADGRERAGERRSPVHAGQRAQTYAGDKHGTGGFGTEQVRERHRIQVRSNELNGLVAQPGVVRDDPRCRRLPLRVGRGERAARVQTTGVVAGHGVRIGRDAFLRVREPCGQTAQIRVDGFHVVVFHHAVVVLRAFGFGHGLRDRLHDGQLLGISIHPS